MTNAKSKKFNVQITPKRKDLLVVVLWIAVITLIMVKAHWMLYLRVPRFSARTIIYSTYEPPSLDMLDIVILTVASLVVSMTISDVKSLIYGSAASLSISYILAVIYVFFYIWFVLGYGSVLSLAPFDWEIAVYYSILNMFWVMIPWVMGLSFAGVVVGFFLRGWLTVH